MAESRLKIDVRRSAILERLRLEGSVSTAKLASTLGATSITIRNDLLALERDGHVSRMRGGAVYLPHDTLATSGADARVNIINEAEKRAIARAIATLVKDQSTIFLNTGTTTQIVAEELRKHRGLNIVTNSLKIAQILGAAPSFHVILLGGRINAIHDFTYGADVEEQLKKYHADLSILSIDGICAQNGISTHLAEESTIDRIMLERSTRRIIAADHTKVGRVGFTNIQHDIASLTLVTDKKCAPLAHKKLEDCGLEIIDG